MEKLIKDNLVFLILPIIALVGSIYGIYNFAMGAYEVQSSVADKQQEVETKKANLDRLKAEAMASPAQQTIEKKVPKSGKVIYEVLGQQFSPEASFGIMLENLISTITNSGIRIRSIEYNYNPQGDMIKDTGAAGYNACELSLVTIGNYANYQTFFKNLAKEKYLTSIYEIYIEPYDKDKRILISKFKIRLYTKTVLN